MIKTYTLADVTVTTAGTRVQVSATDTPVTSIVFQAHPSNTGVVYIGDVSVAAGQGIALAPSEGVNASADLSGRPGGEEMIISDWYVDAATNGNKVKVLYQKRK